MSQEITPNYHEDARIFANLLKEYSLPNAINIGKFYLRCSMGERDRIQYNQSDRNLLDNQQEYTFQILDGELQLSIQLYVNLDNHYRLFCYTKIDGKQGLAFSLNLTTEKESENVIYLAQKLKFNEQHLGNSSIAKAHRRQKQIVFSDLLKKLRYDIIESNDLILGIFDPQKKQLLNTSVDKFLNDFVVVSILKGHFQGNKGFQLEILPTYRKDAVFAGNDEDIVDLPLKIIKNKSSRNVPLVLRYKVLKKDGFKCVACGHGANDGAKLHIDHKTPFSLGGLTELSNL